MKRDHTETSVRIHIHNEKLSCIEDITTENVYGERPVILDTSQKLVDWLARQRADIAICGTLTIRTPASETE